MPDATGTIREVAWEEVFPCLMIVRSLRLAVSVPVLFVATLGTLLMPLGWWAASHVLPESDRSAALANAGDPAELTLSRHIRLEVEDPFNSERLVPRHEWVAPMLRSAGSFVQPMRQLLRNDLTWQEVAYWSLGGFWNIVLWSLFGGVIARMAAVRYGRDEREGIGDALLFVGRRYLAFVGTPFFALSGVVCVVFVSLPVGWLMQSDAGMLVAACVWLFVLIGGVIITIFLLGLLCGWPLIWGALSTEEMGDIFEGAQRTYAYFYSRPIHYAFYALVTLVAGSAVFEVVELATRMTVYGGMWATSWGGGFVTLREGIATGHANALAGASIIGWLNGIALTVPEAFRYGFLFTAASVVYLLVRRDADQIEFDNVQVADPETRYGLPPLATDDEGVPEVATESSGDSGQ